MRLDAERIDGPISVQVADAYTDRVDADRLACLVQLLCSLEGLSSDAQISLVITDDFEIRRLNRAYRGEDQPTDVLAFAAGDGEGFVLPQEAALYLGDVIVSLTTASAQAEEQGHPLDEEIDLLVVHGCLHLVGYDHESPMDQERMWARQVEILRAARERGLLGDRANR